MVESWTTLTFDIHSLVYPPAPPPVQEAPPRVGEVSAVIHSLVRRLVEERNDYDGQSKCLRKQIRINEGLLTSGTMMAHMSITTE